MLYKNLPRNVGLKRLTLHKSATGPNVNYILLVECSHFLDNINQVKIAKFETDLNNVFLVTGSQPTASAASQNMRLHWNLPHRWVLLTFSPGVQDDPPHPRENREPQPRTPPTVTSVRTLASWTLVWNQEVWEWRILCLPFQVLANCASSDRDVSNFQN